MAVNRIYWEHAEDIHLVVGAVSPTLDDLIVIRAGTPEVRVWPRPPSPGLPSLPAGITVRFRAAFNGALAGSVFSGFGVSVDQNTGAVTVASPLPGGYRLRNFLIHAEVRDTTVAPPRDFVQCIRIHVHSAVTKCWLTPAPLTIRQGANGLRFSVFAQFDDNTVGDISRLPGLAWASATPASIAVDPDTGELTANVAGASVDITVTLPVPYGCTATARAEARPPWSTPVTAKLIAGSAGAAQMTDSFVPNFLFLPDGFTTGEQALFETTVQELVTFLCRSPATRPFDLCSGQINYWMAWIESRERGTSPLYEIVPLRRRGKTVGCGVWPDYPNPNSQMLSQLIDKVGLPVPAQGAAAVTLATQQAEWTALFGAGVAAGVDAALHAGWKALADRRIVNECDTALGLALGARPSAEGIVVNRVITWHTRRTTRAQLDAMLLNIRDAAVPAGPAIGATWGVGGKDRHFVIVLCAGARRGGARSHAPNELIAMGLVSDSEVELAAVPGTIGFKSVPFRVPTSLPLAAKCMIAHESAHAMGLGDEYGYSGTLPVDRVGDVKRFLNLQDADSASMVPLGIGIDPTRLKWNWPRISKAGVLNMPPQPDPANPGSFQLLLRRGHGALFAAGDRVRLRTRPLTAGIVPSALVQVTLPPAGDQLVVSGPGFNPAPYGAGSIVYVQRESASGVPLGLISPAVLAHMSAGIPLNVEVKPGPPVVHTCKPDPNDIQYALNKPRGVRVGRGYPVTFSSWIVGAFEGGAAYGCGVYHPTGACIMRQLQLAREVAFKEFKVFNVAYRFCPVCRYILVDYLDPSKHGKNDADYQGRYAEP